MPSAPVTTATSPSPKGRSSEGYAAVFATILIWSTPSLFQFYLNRYYDPFAQNFYRYSVGCLAILPFALYRFRKSGPRLDWRVVGACLIPALPNFLHQVTQTLSLYYMCPRLYALFPLPSLVITALPAPLSVAPVPLCHESKCAPNITTSSFRLPLPGLSAIML